MKGGILLFEKWHGKDNIGSSRIRGHWLVKYWDELELFQQGAKYDFIIFQKVYWLEYVKNYKGIKILDLCDPDWLDGAQITEIIDECDAITTSTEALRDAVKQFTDKPVIYIPDRQDLEFHPPMKKEHKDKVEWLVWFGYSHNNKVLDPAMRTLSKLGLKLKVISNCRPPYAKANLNVKFDFDNPDFDFNKEITECDLVLMTPDTRPRGKFKSLNKTYTSWCLGMPVVSNKEDLEKFLDKDEREKESERVKEYAKKNLDVKISVDEFKNLINQIHEKRKR